MVYKTLSTKLSGDNNVAAMVHEHSTQAANQQLIAALAKARQSGTCAWLAACVLACQNAALIVVTCYAIQSRFLLPSARLNLAYPLPKQFERPLLIGAPAKTTVAAPHRAGTWCLTAR